ncbi:MAG: hypothetical protein KF764_31265 [Labilithrix sp.]|nr:hypothetical protein [Labilithrix sp.]MBX3220004.1 hypothetical protein [Labilithrix sp.]
MATESDKDEAGAKDDAEGTAARASSRPPPAKSKKKKKSAAEVQKELAEIGKAQEDRPPVDLKKIYVRVGLVVAVVWVIAFIVPVGGFIPKAVAGVATLVAIGVMVWLDRYVKKTQALGAILKGADTEEGRKKALERLDTEFKKGDTQAVIAKAQLQMQEDPRAALATLESVNVDKELGPIAGQVRAMRAMLHLTLGETAEARALADKLELGKQQEPKTRVMFAAVAGEAWARSGQGQKAVDTLDLFNPDAPEHAEMKAQMWRARAFAYAAVNDTKGIARALKKLADVNPHLLGMFLPPQKKVHPLLEREAKQMVARLGIVQRKMVRQKM